LSPLILASASPRRAEILRSLGIPFEVRPVNVDESPLAGETAEAAAARLAADKAALSARDHPESWVLAADTLVFLDGAILGKPRDDAEAAAMLRRLAGREHGVVTAVHLLDESRAQPLDAVGAGLVPRLAGGDVPGDLGLVHRPEAHAGALPRLR